MNWDWDRDLPWFRILRGTKEMTSPCSGFKGTIKNKSKTAFKKTCHEQWYPMDRQIDMLRQAAEISPWLFDFQLLSCIFSFSLLTLSSSPHLRLLKITSHSLPLFHLFPQPSSFCPVITDQKHLWTRSPLTYFFFLFSQNNFVFIKQICSFGP